MPTATPRTRAPERTAPGRRGLAVVTALALGLVAVAVIALRDRTGSGEPPPGAAQHGHGADANRSGAGRLITGAPAYPVPDAAVRTVATGLYDPGGMGFRPDGTALVTERRSGRVLAVRPDGQVTEVHRIGGVVADGGGGLLGVASSPAHATDGWLYLFHTSAQDNRVIRVRTDGTTQPVVTGIPHGPARNGGAIVFGPDGMLYIGTGDAGDTSLPADPRSLAGKVLRVTPDGGPAPGNPVPGSMVYSRGYRDPQGLAWYGQTDLFLADAGSTAAGAPDRHDELNLVQANGDYGWPAISGPSTSGSVNPVATWHPGEAGFGGIAVTGGRVYLAGTKLYRIWLEGTEPQTLLDGRFGRLRATATAPDGALWLATTAGALLRIIPEAL
jgi:glucose/arabinose dehydrogenase